MNMRTISKHRLMPALLSGFELADGLTDPIIPCHFLLTSVLLAGILLLLLAQYHKQLRWFYSLTGS